MDNFVLFVAPFLVLIAGLCITFWVAPKDGAVREKDE